MPPYLVPLDPSDLPALLGSDASLYPSPLTLASLASWTTAAPYLSLKYVLSPISKSPCGICISLPLLSHYWEFVIRGDLKEWDITPEHLWSPSNPSTHGERVGLHVWHIERFGDWKQEWGNEYGFGEYCWKDIHSATKFMLQNGCERIIGYSALCVTPAGEYLFRERLSFTESQHYGGQVVVKHPSSGETAIIERKDWESMASKGEVIANCKMLVKFI